MQIRFADTPYVSKTAITEDWIEYHPGEYDDDHFTHGGTEPAPVEGTHVPVWRIYLDPEFVRSVEPFLDMSWLPMGSWDAMSIEYPEEDALELTFFNASAAEMFVERINRIIRNAFHGWRGGEPPLED